MTTRETSLNGMPDMMELFGAFRVPGLDLEGVVAAQRKNLEALTQANQLAVEGVQSLARRQVEIARQAMDEASAVLRDWTAPATPEERMAKNAELANQAFEKNVAIARELAELATKAGTDVFSVFARRLSAGFDEVRLYAKKQASAL
ncbi:MAG: phasin family protein [Stellaceae bacterium]